MYFLKCLLLKSILLIFCIKLCLCKEDDILETFDCNCDVQIDVVQNVLQNLEKLEKLMEKIDAQNEAQHLENLLPNTCLGICYEAAAGTFKSGIYDIQINRNNDSSTFEVWCDEETDFGGWIVIQRRVSADEDFYSDKNDYKHGFGNLSANFWLGLDKLHALTTSCEQELYIKMELFNGTKYYAKYDLIVVGSEAENYFLKKIVKYSGTVRDSFTDDKSSEYSKYNTDLASYNNLAVTFLEVWWYMCSYRRNPNGDYTIADVVIGLQTVELYKGLKLVEMMIRPTDNCKKRLTFRC